MAICERGCTIKDQHLETCQGTCWGCLPLHTEGVICSKCEERFSKSLDQIVEAWSDLYSQMGHSTDYSLGERVSGTPAIGLVLNEAVMAVMDEVRDWALFVTRIVITEDSGKPEDISTVNVIRFIKLHERFLAGHELAGEFVEDASRLARKVFNTAYPDGSRRISIPSSQCQSDVDGQKCGGALFAMLREPGSKTASAIHCKKNKDHKVEATQWVELGKRLRELA
jgi:hypothetical protein